MKVAGLRGWGKTALAVIAAAFCLGGCQSAPAAEEGPKPGELRTSDGKPISAEASNAPGMLPAGTPPPPFIGGVKGKK